MTDHVYRAVQATSKKCEVTPLLCIVVLPQGQLFTQFICNAVTQEGLSYRRAAEEYQIPKSTFQDHISGRVCMGTKSGQQHPTDSEENELVILIEYSKNWFPQARKEVTSFVQNIVCQKGQDVLLTSGWWNSFCKHHLEVTL